MTSLFDPITLRGLTLKNRIWLSPMCQHSVDCATACPPTGISSTSARGRSAGSG